MANKGVTNKTSLSVMIDMNKLLHHYYCSMNSKRTIFIVILKLLQKSVTFE